MGPPPRYNQTLLEGRRALGEFCAECPGGWIFSSGVLRTRPALRSVCSGKCPWSRAPLAQGKRRRSRREISLIPGSRPWRGRWRRPGLYGTFRVAGGQASGGSQPSNHPAFFLDVFVEVKVPVFSKVLARNYQRRNDGVALGGKLRSNLMNLIFVFVVRRPNHNQEIEIRILFSVPSGPGTEKDDTIQAISENLRNLNLETLDNLFFFVLQHNRPSFSETAALSIYPIPLGFSPKTCG